MGKLWEKIKKFGKGALKYFRLTMDYRQAKLRYNHLFLNITSYCNSNCVYCEVKCLDHKNDLEFERQKKLIAEARELGVKEVSFSGGEPFVYYKVWELIDYVLSLGMELNIMSNGLMINDFTPEKINTLKKLKRIFISLESADAKTHNELRGGRDFFEKTMAGVKKMLSAGVKVSFASVLSNKNYSGLADLIKLTEESGVNSVFFQPLHVWSNYDTVENIKDKEKLIPAEDDFSALRESIRRSIKLAKKLGVDNNLPALKQWVEKYYLYQKGTDKRGRWIDNIMPSYKCLEIFTKIFIDCDGGVLPCAMLSPQDNLNHKSLKDSLVSLDAIKQSIAAGIFPKECDECSCQVASNFTFSLLLSPIKNIKNLFVFIKDKF
ncbi:MAG: radical SAM protein [Patescibacteria group bacterium]|nr:radical SAM protein [Patescibacteria group bacterium]